MANLETLRSHGWHITPEGLNILTENGSVTDIRNITRRALNLNIRDFGAAVITSELNKPTFGPVNLQIVKIRNISAPKSKQNSQAAPRMLKLILTDGHENCQGIEVKNLPFLSLDKTAPGTKIFINGAPVLSGSILLSPENCKLLGGTVSALVEKWEFSKLIPNNIHRNENGPPPWVNFGKKIVNTLDSRGFKSLENKNKENTKENADFQNQRQDAILEATQGAVKKVFGGGVKPAQTFNSHEVSNHYNNRENRGENFSRAPRQPKGKNKEKSEPEKMEKPSQGVSLFDFLEDKLPLSETNQSKSFTSTSRVFNEVPPPKPKPDYFESKNKSYLNTSQKQSNRESKFKSPQNSYSNPSSFNNRQENDIRPKIHQSEGRFQSDRPPRFQKQRQDGKFSQEPRPKPNTNIFVDKLANEINNISLYNSKYENEKLKQPTRSQEVLAKTWHWKVGDKCMAKYWEDDKFYNAVVTGITNKTCMVEFVDYGNFEEVLHCDCIPITSEKEDRKQSNRFTPDNQDFSGSIEFKRGKTRPYNMKSANRAGQNKNYDS